MIHLRTRASRGWIHCVWVSSHCGRSPARSRLWWLSFAAIRPNRCAILCRTILTRIHAERGQALQAFDGDSSTFLDVEAQLRECVQLRQERPPAARTRFPWPALLIGICLLGLAGWGTFIWWRDRSAWQAYLTLLRAQPGIVITDIGKHDGKWQISGLRDPLAADPTQLLHGLAIDPTRVVGHWQPYQAFNAALVLKRFAAALRPLLQSNLR